MAELLTDQFWSLLELFGVVTGFLFLWLEIKQKPSMWLVGGICSLIYLFVFAVARIYADMGFNIYNALISIYGYAKWRHSLRNGTTRDVHTGKIEYSSLSLQQIVRILSVSVLIYGAIFTLLKEFTDSPIPQGDAFTTTLSIVATWMLAKRIIQHWLVWIVVNLVSVYLYSLRGLYPTMFLYAIYTVAAAMGYYIWKKKGVRYDSNAF